MSDVAAEVCDLRMRYGATGVLDGIDFEIRTGEVVALLGPNGAGKTTTIEILEGFRARSAGQATVLLTTHRPGWLQVVGQAFPMYWLGLGMRAALLPSHLAAVEIGGSWRLPYVFLALALWSLLGLAAAPPVLRRMARRESGSRVAERRERAMLRAT